MSCATNKPQMARTESPRSARRSESRRSMGMLERTSLSSFSVYVGEKQVRFRERSNRVHEVRHLDDYTDEEVDAYWYGRDEYDTMKRNRKRAEKKLREGDDEEYSCGLETDTDAALRISTSKESIRSVLLEQERKWEEDHDDPNIATVFFLNTSFAAHLDARERARGLEATIKSFVSSGRWAPAPSKRPSLQKQTQPRSGSFRLRAPMQPIRMDSFSLKKSEYQEPPKLPMREDSFGCKSSFGCSISEECASVALLKSLQGSPLRECLDAFTVLGGRGSFRGKSKSLHLQVDDTVKD
jgi:hypothetical protein